MFVFTVQLLADLLPKLGILIDDGLVLVEDVLAYVFEPVLPAANLLQLLENALRLVARSQRPVFFTLFQLRSSFDTLILLPMLSAGYLS